MDSEYYNGLILYFSRSLLYQSMQKASLDGLVKFPSHSLFRMYNGIALSLGNRIQEAIRELKSLKSDKDFGLAAVGALIFANNQIEFIDQREISSLENLFEKLYSSSSDLSLYYAALVLYLTGQNAKCRELMGKISSNEMTEKLLVLGVWNDISDYIEIPNETQIDLEKVVRKEFSFDASLALVRLYQVTGLFDSAIQLLNKLSIRYPELNIFVIEKMNIYLSSLDWDQAYETSLRIINIEPLNIYALLTKVIVLILKECKINYANTVLCQLLKAIEQLELNSIQLVVSVCTVISRTCSRNKEILDTIKIFLERITKLNCWNNSSLTEYGFILLMMEHYEDALACFESVLKKEDYNERAIAGSLICRNVLNKPRESIKKDIEKYRIVPNVQCEPHFLYLKCLMSDVSVEAIKLLNKATDLQLDKLKNKVFSIEYLSLLNPDFLIDIVLEYLRYSPSYKDSATDACQHIALSQASFILEKVLSHCPNHLEATYMMAMLHFISGNLFGCVKFLQKILNHIDIAHSNSKLLLAKVAIEQGQYLNASHTLELALSNNFSVRKNPLYFYLLGMVESKTGKIESALKNFSNALQLIDITQKKSGSIKSNNARPSFEFTRTDQLTLYLEYSRLLRSIGDHGSMFENERIMQLAAEEFKNSKEEGRLFIAQAQFMTEKGNITDSIKILEDVSPDQPYFQEVNAQLANIYLKYRKNRVAYANCFKKVLQHSPEPRSYQMLAEAYMKIQEPMMSLKIAQLGFEKFPHNTAIATQLGRTYVKAHQYANAIKFYKSVVEMKSHLSLNIDLGELYLKLNMFEEGINLLEQIEDQNIEHDMYLMSIRTKTLLLLARIYEKSGKLDKSLEVLKKAKANQWKLKETSYRHVSDNDENSSYLKICLQIAERAIQTKDTEYALKCLEECLNIYTNNVDILVALARLHLLTNSMQQAYSICEKISEIDKNNEVSSIMMADISYRKLEFENAAYHFSQLLIKNPHNWVALIKLTEIMRRTGNLFEAQPYIDRAQVFMKNPSDVSAYSYCKGLYEWWTGNPNNALLYFNKSKKDPEWGKKAMFHMIEICVNPEGSFPDPNEVLDLNDTINMDADEPRIVAFRTAEKLLKELSSRIDCTFNEKISFKLLQNFLLMASRIKYQIDKAFKSFNDLCGDSIYKNMIGPIYGSASCLILLKQTQKGKSALKAILNIEWNIEEAEYFEKSWLLLANIYINSNKLDAAENLIMKTLDHNRSCTKAYELAGIIAEKSQSYKDAVKHYNRAWKTGGKSNKHIGYKLAFAYMKLKNFADAMLVANEMLALNPDWKSVHKDILEKCRSNLKM